MRKVLQIEHKQGLKACITIIIHALFCVRILSLPSLEPGSCFLCDRPQCGQIFLSVMRSLLNRNTLHYRFL